jgi:hypothetical protein
MRRTLQAYLTRGETDLPRLASALDKLADAAPPEYPRWAPIARGAADAARRDDVAAIKRACGDCHDTYRTSFRETMRARRLFP